MNISRRIYTSLVAKGLMILIRDEFSGYASHADWYIHVCMCTWQAHAFSDTPAIRSIVDSTADLWVDRSKEEE